jgi:hypothetical protein
MGIPRQVTVTFSNRLAFAFCVGLNEKSLKTSLIKKKVYIAYTVPRIKYAKRNPKYRRQKTTKIAT